MQAWTQESSSQALSYWITNLNWNIQLSSAGCSHIFHCHKLWELIFKFTDAAGLDCWLLHKHSISTLWQNVLSCTSIPKCCFRYFVPKLEKNLSKWTLFGVLKLLTIVQQLFFYQNYCHDKSMIFVTPDQTKLFILSHNAQNTSGMPKYALCSI